MELNSYSRYKRTIRKLILEKNQDKFEDRLKEYRMVRRAGIAKANEVKLRSKLIQARKNIRVMSCRERYNSSVQPFTRHSDMSSGNLTGDILTPGVITDDCVTDARGSTPGSEFREDLKEIEGREMGVNRSIERLNRRLANLSADSSFDIGRVKSGQKWSSISSKQDKSFFLTSIYTVSSKPAKGVLLIDEGVAKWIN